MDAKSSTTCIAPMSAAASRAYKQAIREQNRKELQAAIFGRWTDRLSYAVGRAYAAAYGKLLIEGTASWNGDNGHRRIAWIFNRLQRLSERQHR